MVMSIDTLQDILDRCSDKHDLCIDCPHLIPCRELWDRASELAHFKEFTPRHFDYYVNEFSRLWLGEELDDINSPEDFAGVLLKIR